MNFEKLLDAIEKAEQVVKALVPLALDLGTLIAVIKMVIDSIR